MSESARMARNQEVTRKVQATELQASAVADTRWLTWCSFSPDSKMLATGSRTGLCKLWSVPECAEIRTLRGHQDSVGSVVFSPLAASVPGNVASLASGAADGSVRLWSIESDLPVASLDGHEDRVSRCAYHPSGRYLATCVYDNSWRLWDLERREEVLHQEGHSRAVHCVSFQVDGALCATGGRDSFGRVWDLRTGQCIMFLAGHTNDVIGIDWSPNGYHIFTGGSDNACKVWDLRRRSSEYSIPAHTKLVSNVAFERAHGGEFVVSSSFDGTAKLWTAKTWQPLHTLQGHDGMVTGCDVSPDGSLIATCSSDRTFKLWAPN